MDRIGLDWSFITFRRKGGEGGPVKIEVLGLVLDTWTCEGREDGARGGLEGLVVTEVRNVWTRSRN